jgi:hypothetical protein
MAKDHGSSVKDQRGLDPFCTASPFLGHDTTTPGELARSNPVTVTNDSRRDTALPGRIGLALHAAGLTPVPPSARSSPRPQTQPPVVRVQLLGLAQRRSARRTR